MEKHEKHEKHEKQEIKKCFCKTEKCNNKCNEKCGLTCNKDVCFCGKV